MERAKKEIENIRIDEAKKYAQTLVDKGILKPTEIDVSCRLSYFSPFFFFFFFFNVD